MSDINALRKNRFLLNYFLCPSRDCNSKERKPPCDPKSYLKSLCILLREAQNRYPAMDDLWNGCISSSALLHFMALARKKLESSPTLFHWFFTRMDCNLQARTGNVRCAVDITDCSFYYTPSEVSHTRLFGSGSPCQESLPR